MKKETWSPYKLIDSKPPEPWVKERWYSGDINGCMGGAYYSRLGKTPTNPPDARGQRVMRMGKQMELLLVNDIKRYYLKPISLKTLVSPGYLFKRLKEIFWNDETFEAIKKIWYDESIVFIDKFNRGLDLFTEGWEKVCFNGYKDSDIIDIFTQYYIRDEKLDVGLRLDLLIICKKKPSIIYEIKSINSKAFWWMSKGPKGFQPKEDHKSQAHLYLYELRDKFPGIQAKVLYVSRDDMTTQECGIEYDEKLAKSAVKKFELLNKCWKEQTPPPVEPAIILEDGKYKVNWKAKYCSHHGICLGDLKWEQKAELEVARLNNELFKEGKIIKTSRKKK